MELSKSYDAAATESAVARVWNEENCFHAEPDPSRESFVVVIPPPNVTAALHLGHALNNTIQDILVRRARMRGLNAVWLPGTDHAGIATQSVVEKRVLAEEGKRRTDFERDEFVAKIQAWKDEYEQTILGQLKAMGCSCDFDRTAFTMDEQRAKAVREAFFRLFKDGLIYRGKRLVNWDPVTQTALADDEVEMEDIDGSFWYLKYPLVDSDETVTVATTRPETMLGDTAVAVNPKDEKRAHLIGRKVRLPIVDREIPIVGDEYVVIPDPESSDPKAKYASGFLKVTPAHDPNDWDIGQRHDLDVINIMAPDASISDAHGWTPETDAAKAFVGKSREDARTAVVEWFKDNGLLAEVRPYSHAVGHSYRSHVPVEPYLSDQWYVAMQKPIGGESEGNVEGTDIPKNSLAGYALTALSGDQRELPPEAPFGRRSTNQLSFIPDRYAKTYHAWHANLRDWCISRQLWWGHRIPVWTFALELSGIDGVHTAAGIKEGRYRAFERAKVRLEELAAAEGQPGCFVFDFNFLGAKIRVTPRNSEAIGILQRFIAYKRSFAAQEVGKRTQYAEHDADNRPIYHNTHVRETAAEALLALHSFDTIDPDVLDTWFSSALWPISTLGWPDDTAELKAWNPTTVLCTAREIITLWVGRMVMFNRYFRGGDLPFNDVFIHAMIQDGHGQKMSKSLGNGVDPLDIIHSHGADAMRFTLCQMTTHTQDVRMPVDMVDPHTGETFEPKTITNKAGFTVAAPIQEHGGKKMVSSYGLASGEASPTDDMPLARNTSSKFDLGRNFCNKLWNASRFVIGNLDGDASVGELSAVDRWILSRLAKTIDAVNDAAENYRFDRYATAIYDFVWRDYCDWYIEAAKPALRDEATAATTRAVLSTCLDAALRLLSPITPFVTEKLWWALNDVAPSRGIPGMFDLPPSERCMLAAWPTGNTDAIDEEAEATIATLQELATAIRTVRNENNADPRKKYPVTIAGASDAVQANASVIELWATCTVNFGNAPADAAKTTAAGCEVYVEGVIDKAAGAKRKAELERKIKAMQGRLANKGYTDKAPAHLVQQTRDELAAAEAELAALS
ncbi:MAG: valine--tRNA ligase [Planctomycetota bacterium]